MRNLRLPLAVTLIAALTAPTIADTLVLKDGTAVQGNYKGGSDAELLFEVGGATKMYPLHTVTTISLSPRPEPAPAAPAAAAAGTAAAAGAGLTAATHSAPPLTKPVTLAAGTKLMINFTKAVSTASHPTGSSFEVLLEQDLVVEGMAVATKGTPVYGKVMDARGGKKVGAQYLKLELTGLSRNNQLVPITTEQFGVEGGRGQTAKTVGAAALVGAAIDGGSGAATGAAIGGAVALLAPGSHVQFPAGTIMEVPLKAPVTVSP